MGSLSGYWKCKSNCFKWLLMLARHCPNCCFCHDMSLWLVQVTDSSDLIRFSMCKPNSSSDPCLIPRKDLTSGFSSVWKKFQVFPQEPCWWPNSVYIPLVWKRHLKLCPWYYFGWIWFWSCNFCAIVSLNLIPIGYRVTIVFYDWCRIHFFFFGCVITLSFDEKEMCVNCY